MKTITFYSYKGGVGRSLALSNVANRLAEFGKKVCIMDFDLEAPGLHLKFSHFIGDKGVRNGLVDYIDSFSQTGDVPANIKDFVTWISFDDQDDRRNAIALIAAGNTKSNDYWNKVCSIDWKHYFYQKDSVGIEFFYNLKHQIHSQLDPDFLLIDSRTGITDISGVTMSIMADEVVLLAANNSENLEGITQVIKTLIIPENSIENRIPKINFVLTRIPYFQNAKDKPRETNATNKALWKINKELIDSGLDRFTLNKVLVIHSDPDLELQETFKIAYQSEFNKDPERSVIGLDYLALFEEITQGMITDEERNSFDSFMKVELLIQKAKSTNDLQTRIKLLLTAVELNKRSGKAYAELALAHYDLGMYQEALVYFDKAEKYDSTTSFKYKVHRGICYSNLLDFNKALKLFKESLEHHPKADFLLNQISNVYYRKGDFDRALEYAKRSIELSPESYVGLNIYGNTLRRLGRFDESIDPIYKALELNPQDIGAIGTLAEIYAEVGNDREFYRNLEQCFSLGMTSDRFQVILQEEPIYKKYYDETRFNSILKKYGIEIIWEQIIKNNRNLGRQN